MQLYKKKLMVLIDVLKTKLSRHKDKRKDLEKLIDEKVASSSQKQQYIETKAKEEEVENIIDLAEGLLKEDKTE